MSYCTTNNTLLDEEVAVVSDKQERIRTALIYVGPAGWWISDTLPLLFYSGQFVFYVPFLHCQEDASNFVESLHCVQQQLIRWAPLASAEACTFRLRGRKVNWA